MLPTTMCTLWSWPAGAQTKIIRDSTGVQKRTTHRKRAAAAIYRQQLLVDHCVLYVLDRLPVLVEHVQRC